MLLLLLLARGAHASRGPMTWTALLLLLARGAHAFALPNHDDCLAQAAPGCLEILKAVHLERIFEYRGAPYATNGSGEAYLEHLNATVGVRARIGLGAAHAEAEQKGYRLSLPGETQRYPGSVHVRGNFFIAAAFKLEHDARQIRHLVAAGKLPPGFRHLEGAYLDIYGGIHYSTRAQFMTQKLLNVKQHALLFGAHNALVYLPPEESVHRALGAQFLREASILEAAYLEDAKHGRAPAFYADGFLSNEALETLYEWCLDATVWFDAKPGYLGAYFDDGFSPKVLLQVVEELRKALPQIVGSLNLKTAWAYKYDSHSTNTGIAVHADPAAVNVNFWVTPDASNLGAAGGLIVHRQFRGDAGDWNGIEYAAKMRAHLDQLERDTGVEPLRVPYKRNRAVIFDSSLLHETDAFLFKKGYRHRRINLTLLFGLPRKRGATEMLELCVEVIKGKETCVRMPLSKLGVQVLTTNYVDRVLNCSRRESRDTLQETPAAKEATKHAVALCTARALHAAGDSKLAIEVLQSRSTQCGTKAAASDAEWQVCGTLAALHQAHVEATEMFFAKSLDDILRWQRHTTFVLDERICDLTKGEFERWKKAPSVLVHVPRTSGTTLRALYSAVLNETQLAVARHYSAAQMRACSPRTWDAKHVVAVVRDPWARAVSAFDHLVNVSSVSKHASDRYFGTWLTLFDDFSDFVETGGLELAAKACAHFLPSLDWVADPRTGDVRVNQVRRYERLHAAGIDAALNFTRLREAAVDLKPFYTRGPPGRADGHCGRYTRRAAEVVARVYGDDARAFGYSNVCAEYLPRRPVAKRRYLPGQGGDDASTKHARRRAADLFVRRREDRAWRRRAQNPGLSRKFRRRWRPATFVL